jgi:hypothetical protein
MVQHTLNPAGFPDLPLAQDKGPRVHVVSPDEGLPEIARRYGFADWRPIYQAACNDEFRRLRPEPDRIRLGDRLRIPPKPDELVVALLHRLAALRLIREETTRLFEHLEIELRRTYGSFELSANAVEHVAKLFLNKVQIVKKSLYAMRPWGDAIARSHVPLLASALKFRYEPLHDQKVRRELEELGANDGVQSAFAAVGALVVTLVSPAFWAEVYTTGLHPVSSDAPDGELDEPSPITEAIGRVRGLRDQVLVSVDSKIRDAERHLADASSNVLSLYGGPPPDDMLL